MSHDLFDLTGETAAVTGVLLPCQVFGEPRELAGDVAQFEKEFGDDLMAIELACRQYDLPQNLKLSVHSGSDKFSIYAPMKRALTRYNKGVHIKTAGTTWLEELIGLAEAGGEGLALAKRDLRRRARKAGSPLRAVRRRDRHRRQQAAFGARSRGLDVRAVRRCAPARSRLAGLQSLRPPASPRRLQDRRADGRPLPCPVELLRADHRSQRDRQPVRPAYRAAVPRSGLKIQTAIPMSERETMQRGLLLLSWDRSA